MKERYIRQVGRYLRTSQTKKREILRDLEETFAAAAEHGETEQQVLDRLGTPEEFAAAMAEPGDEAVWRRQRTVRRLLTALAAAAAIFGVRAAAMAAREASLGIIGGADGPTMIFVAGPGHSLWELLLNLTAGPGWAGVLGLLGLLALVTAAVLLIRLLWLTGKKG